MSLLSNPYKRQIQEYHTQLTLNSYTNKKRKEELKKKQGVINEPNANYVGNFIIHTNNKSKLTWSSTFNIGNFRNHEQVNREMTSDIKPLKKIWGIIGLSGDLVKTAKTWKLDASQWALQYHPDAFKDLDLDFNYDEPILVKKKKNGKSQKSMKKAKNDLNLSQYDTVQTSMKKAKNDLILSQYNTVQTLKYLESQSTPNHTPNPVMDVYVKEWELMRNNWSKFINYVLSSPFTAQSDKHFTTHYGTISSSLTIKDAHGFNKIITKKLVNVPVHMINTKKVKLEALILKELASMLEDLKVKSSNLLDSKLEEKLKKRELNEKIQQQLKLQIQYEKENNWSRNSTSKRKLTF